MPDSFELDTPEHFTAGAVGAPGQRVFYLQGRQGGRLVTFKCEKELVGALGDYLANLLRRLGAAEGEGGGAPGLAEPLESAWDVGSIGVGYDDEAERFVIVLQEALEESEDEDQPAREPATARFHITRPQARTFVEAARGLIRAGRPICPMCSRPKDPGGHVCPRANGHAARPA